MTHMVGSYAPKEDVQSYTTPMEDAPSGMIARGHYTVKSLFTDDDNNEHLKWEWSFNIKKDWNWKQMRGLLWWACKSIAKFTSLEVVQSGNQ